MYAKRLTKERLIQEGFTEITKEGRLVYLGGSCNPYEKT